MLGNKFEVVFYSKILSINLEDDTRVIYLPSNGNSSGDITGKRGCHLFNWSMCCGGR